VYIRERRWHAQEQQWAEPNHAKRTKKARPASKAQQAIRKALSLSLSFVIHRREEAPPVGGVSTMTVGGWRWGARVVGRRLFVAFEFFTLLSISGLGSFTSYDYNTTTPLLRLLRVVTVVVVVGYTG
jgi:hypothetical protein